MKYFETSAKNGLNLNEMLRSLAYDILDLNNMEKVIFLTFKNDS
jgi:hypothetical protein